MRKTENDLFIPFEDYAPPLSDMPPIQAPSSQHHILRFQAVSLIPICWKRVLGDIALAPNKHMRMHSVIQKSLRHQFLFSCKVATHDC